MKLVFSKVFIAEQLIKPLKKQKTYTYKYHIATHQTLT
jgi:hypothetical protein